MERRHFIQTSVAAAAASLSPPAPAQVTEPDKTIRVGIAGCGTQMRQFMSALAKIPPEMKVSVAAVYDPILLRQKAAQRTFETNGLTVATPDSFEKLLTDHRLDALIIASPDHCHAPQAIAAMEAGIAVFCEVPLAPTLQDARAIIAAQRKTGQLLQAGYQRRSNPRYRQLQSDVIQKHHLPGRITKAYSQWNRSVKPMLLPKFSPEEKEAIKALGYADTVEFANWRNRRKFSTGQAHALGAYGVNTVNWLLGALPDRVIASGGTDYYDGKEGRPLMESPDNFTAVFHYTIGGYPVRYTCQVNLDTGSGGHYEKIMGLDGWAVISESPGFGNEVFREVNAADDNFEKYDTAFREGVLKVLSNAVYLTETSRMAETVDGWGGPTTPVTYLALARQEKQIPAYYHLENFFRVLAKKGAQSELACPAEHAWTTLVCMDKLQQSIDQRREVEITAADFAV